MITMKKMYLDYHAAAFLSESLQKKNEIQKGAYL